MCWFETNYKEKQLKLTSKGERKLIVTDSRQTAGLTLIELMIIIAILGVVVAMFVPALIKYGRKTGVIAPSNTTSPVAKSEPKQQPNSQEFKKARREYLQGLHNLKKTHFYHFTPYANEPWTLSDSSLCATLTVEHRRNSRFLYSYSACTRAHIEKARQQALFYSGQASASEAEAPPP